MFSLLAEKHWQSTPDEQLVYDHLLLWVQAELPEQVIDRFKSLFFVAFGTSDWEVQAALDRIAALPDAQTSFKLFFNRCCYILINRWQSQPQFQDAVPEFFALLETPLNPPLAGLARSQSVKRLRSLVKSYLQSSHYNQLCRTAQFLLEDEQDVSQIKKHGSRPLIGLIRRYPYLYSHCLLSDDSSFEQKQAIQRAQGKAQKQFEVDLSQFLTYELRRQSARMIQPVKNPTLLTEGELKLAMKQFVGKVDRNGSYREMANRFTVQSSQIRTCQGFKDDFYEYLTNTVDTQFGGGRFHNQLHDYLNSIAAANSSQPFNDFALVRTCNQVLNFLVVESPQRPQHFVFMDLLNNVGTTATVGLLLKIVLVCKKVKPYLEKRFAILFSHYETQSRSNVQWLVNCLEQLNIAWSTHFGSLDFSFANQIIC
ncbi:MAG: hypothetical protein KME35_06820 [Aphanocapsa sp. GSE-SYN-MK-11-07L]|jgi:hypothetical protein|nr:hypothetical protein [Aphanocapsa sp. GSE-SYN-MK-11-07L]